VIQPDTTGWQSARLLAAGGRHRAVPTRTAARTPLEAAIEVLRGWI
jgi:hypothetical protein